MMMTDTLPLFDRVPMPEKVTERAIRNEAAERAFEKADEAFKREYLALAMQFIEKGEPFIPEDVRKLYTSRPWLPQPSNWRATGNIYKRLQEQGVIETCGTATRDNGNLTAAYRRKG